MTFKRTNAVFRVFIISLILLVVPIAYFNTSHADAADSPCYASGSYSLMKNRTGMQHRIYTIYETGLNGANADTQGILKKTIVNVYMKKGETLYLGSSIAQSYLDQNATLTKSDAHADILLDTPSGDRKTFDVIKDGDGFIVNAVAEAAGPYIEGKNEGANTYKPLTYTAEEDGVYQLYFQSKKGTPGSPGSSPTEVGKMEAWGAKERDCCIAAWNATVLGTDGEVKTGRSFTKALAIHSGGAAAAFNANTFVQTPEGFIYKVDMTYSRPRSIVFFANNRGLVDASTNTSALQSYRYDGSSLESMGVEFQNPFDADTDLDKTANIFFEEPSPELMGIIYPKAYAAEKAKNLKFTTAKDKEQGGYFTFDVNGANSAEVVIDMSAMKNDNGESRGVVKLSNAVKDGNNKFYWDGKDANGDLVPAGSYDSSQMKVTLSAHVGEMHYPLFDMNRMTDGMSITRLNNIYERTADGDKDVTSEYDKKKSYIYYNNPSGVADGKDCAENGVESAIGSHKGAMSYNDATLGNNTAIDVWSYAARNDDEVTMEGNVDIKDTSVKAMAMSVSWDDEDNIPASAKMTLQAYYMLNGVRVDLDQVSYDLNKDNNWKATDNTQPAFITVGNQKYDIYHEIVSEEYTMKDGKTFTVTPSKDGDESATADNPYSTTFKTTAGEDDVTSFTATNARKNKTLEATVADKDDHSKTLSGATLKIWKATDIKDVPTGKNDNYYTLDGVIYINIATATTEDDGIVSAEDLSAGTYLVTQTAAHYGYNMIEEPVAVAVVSSDSKKEVTIENERSDAYCLFYNWKNYEPAEDVAILPTTDELFDTEEDAKTAGEAQSEVFDGVSVRGTNNKKVGTWTFDKWAYDKTEGKDVYVSGEWKFEEDEYTVKYEWDGNTPGDDKVTLPKDTTVYNTVDEAKAAVDTTCDSVKVPYVNDKYESGNWVFDGWDEGTLDKENNVITFKGGWKFEQDEADKTTPWHVEYQWDGDAPSTAPAPIDETEYTSYSEAAKAPAFGVKDSIAGWQNDTECGTWTFNGWESQTVDAKNHKVIRTGSWTYAQKYGVKYQWTGDEIPEGTPVPVDNNAYETKDQAVDSTTGSGALKSAYNKGDSFEGTFDGEYGTWTFNGWHEPDCQETTKTVVVNGEWSFKADAYKVIYSWNGSAEGVMIPVDENIYNTPDIAKNAKDTEYYRGMVVEDVNDDYEKGAWVFSGWDEGTVDEANKTVNFSGTWTYERDAEDAASKWHNTYSFDGETPEGEVAPIDSKDYDSYKDALAGSEAISYESFVAWNADVYGVWTFGGWEKTVNRDEHRIQYTGSWAFTPQYAVQYVWDGTEVPDGYELPTDTTAYGSESAAMHSIDVTTADLSYYEGYSVDGKSHGVDGTWIFTGWQKPEAANDNQVIYVKGLWVFVEGGLYDPEEGEVPQEQPEDQGGSGGDKTPAATTQDQGGGGASSGDDGSKTVAKTDTVKKATPAKSEKSTKTNDPRTMIPFGIAAALALFVIFFLRKRKSNS